MSRSCCTRIDVGIIYICGDYGFWRRCKHYECTPTAHVCKSYSFGRGSSCLSEAAHREADRLNARV